MVGYNNDVSWTLGSLNKLVGLIRPLYLKRWAYKAHYAIIQEFESTKLNVFE